MKIARLNTVEVGERIRELRESNGMSQERLARLMRFTNVTISQIETGKKLSLNFLLIASELFRVSTDYILFGKAAEANNVASIELKSSLPSIDLARLVEVVETGIETEDFLSFPIQAFGSSTQTNGQFPGQIVIHKRVFGRRKNLAAVQLNGGKETKIVIVGK